MGRLGRAPVTRLPKQRADAVAPVPAGDLVAVHVPSFEHAISNSGMTDLVFLVITSPVTEGEKPM